MYGVEKGEKETEFIGISHAAAISGLCPQTLRKYADANQIKCYKTLAGVRKFDRQSLEAHCHNFIAVPKAPSGIRVDYIYTRVSSKKQLDDLARQTEYLRTHRPEYATHVSITDIASGVNFKRKGLQTILDACLQGTIGEIVIAHRDRLCRFGFELIESLVRKSGGKITIVDNQQNKSTEQELAEDLLSIVHIYSCKQMGKRRHRPKKNAVQIPQSEIENETGAEEGD